MKSVGRPGSRLYCPPHYRIISSPALLALLASNSELSKAGSHTNYTHRSGGFWVLAVSLTLASSQVGPAARPGGCQTPLPTAAPCQPVLRGKEEGVPEA